MWNMLPLSTRSSNGAGQDVGDRLCEHLESATVRLK